MRWLQPLATLTAFLISGCDTGLSNTGESRLGAAPDPGPSPALVAPDFPLVVADHVPPPLSGGTLAVLRDGNTAVAADPDLDHIYVINLAAGWVSADIALESGDEPGRVVEDGAGRVHVALRRGGAVVDIDPVAGVITGRRPVCAIPRGLDYDPAGDLIWVACMGGELEALPAAGGPVFKFFQLDRDLRDVVVADSGKLFVSRFRSAEVLTVDRDSGVVLERSQPPSFSDPSVLEGDTFTPSVAWRMIGDHHGGVLMGHQRGMPHHKKPKPHDGYGGKTKSCDSVVHSVISPISSAVSVSAPVMPYMDLVLPLDLALSPDGAYVAVANAGRSRLAPASAVSVAVLPRNGVGRHSCDPLSGTFLNEGQAVAVGYRPNGDLVVQTREPATLQVLSPDGVTIRFPSVARPDTGHLIFHSDSGGGLACASCHPEGGDDGRAWDIELLSPHRTPSLRGGLLERAPFHWAGDLPGIGQLVDLVFVQRMAGPELTVLQKDALAFFLESIPELPAPAVDPQAAARGKALFEDVAGAGCITCHNGSQFTNHTIVDVGTAGPSNDGPFKVPSLRGLAWRAPYMHSGCATTLAGRFGPCGGGRHGQVSNLTDPQIADLVAYLETL